VKSGRKTIVVASAGGAILVGVLSLIGETFRIADLARWSSSSILMAPSTALAFCAQGTFLILAATLPANSKLRTSLASLPLAVGLWGLGTLAGLTSDLDSRLGTLFAGELQVFLGFPVGRMSPVTGGLLALVCIGSVPLSSSVSRRPNRLLGGLVTAASLLSSLGIFVNVAILVGYLYGMPVFYGGMRIPTALPSAIALALTNVALLTSWGPRAVVLGAAFGSTTSARLIRTFFPGLAAGLLLQGWLELHHGFVGLHPAVYNTLFACSISAIVVGVFVLLSRRLGGEIEAAKRDLQESQAKLARAQRIAKVGHWEWNGRVLDGSEEFWRILGLGTGARTAESVLRVVHEGDRERLQSMLTSARELGEERACEVRLCCADGSHKHLHVVGIAQSPHLIMGTTQDISERKLAEAALAQERERLRVTLRSIGDGVVTTDVEGRVTMLNQAAESLTGWTSEAAWGRPLPEVFRIVHETTREVCENPVDKVIATGAVAELANHTCLIRRDGRELVIADSAAPIRDGAGRITGTVLVFRDTTEKQKLLDSMQRAERLESIGILAGGIAHDFNNLLCALFGYLELAQELAPEESEQASYLAYAASAMERARSLTQQLITFSKGGSPIRKPLNLGELAKRVITFSLSGSAVKPTFNIADDLWSCSADENQIAQVLDNITLNARQAMPQGGPLVVQVDNVASPPSALALQPSPYVRISVRDFGEGIEKEHLSRIFDPFFTTKAKGKGTGLGLATTHSIVRKHDGAIDVESRVGEGSTFHVYLPASGDRATAEVVAPRMAAGETTAARRSQRVLIMDDETGVLAVATQVLVRAGHSVSGVANGQEAIDLFRAAHNSASPFTLVILDLTIPGGMGGKEALTELRKIDRSVIAIASSGYSEDPIMACPPSFGFAAAIAKPYRQEELAAIMLTASSGTSTGEPGLPQGAGGVTRPSEL